MDLVDHAFGELFEEFALHPEIDDPVAQQAALDTFLKGMLSGKGVDNG